MSDIEHDVAAERDELRAEIERLRAGAALARVELDTAIANRGRSEHNVWLCIERARRYVADDAS